jgi:hypothetical protein
LQSLCAVAAAREEEDEPVKHGHASTSIALLFGSKPPLQQVVYDPAADGPGMSWFSLVFSDAPPPDEVGDIEPMCLRCVVDEYGAEVAVPLDLAVAHQCSVVRDEEAGEWLPKPDYFANEFDEQAEQA